MENKQHPIGDLMSTTMQKIREMVDVNTIVGKPIEAGDVTIIPVSKVSFGFASGGSGAGVNIMPIAFLIVKGDTVRMLPIAPPPGTTVDRVVEMVPEVIDKVTGFIEKQQEKKAETEPF